MLPAILVAVIAALPPRAGAEPANLSSLAPIAGVPVEVVVLTDDDRIPAAEGIAAPVCTLALGGPARAQAPLPGGPVAASGSSAPAAPTPARRPMPRPDLPTADPRDGA